MNQLNEDGFYSIWSTNFVVADCFRELGEHELANELHAQIYKGGIIDTYIKLAESMAKKTNNESVLERLCFAGLIYG